MICRKDMKLYLNGPFISAMWVHINLWLDLPFMTSLSRFLKPLPALNFVCPKFWASMVFESTLHFGNVGPQQFVSGLTVHDVFKPLFEAAIGFKFCLTQVLNFNGWLRVCLPPMLVWPNALVLVLHPSSPPPLPFLPFPMPQPAQKNPKNAFSNPLYSLCILFTLFPTYPCLSAQTLPNSLCWALSAPRSSDYCPRPVWRLSKSLLTWMRTQDWLWHSANPLWHSLDPLWCHISIPWRHG